MKCSDFEYAPISEYSFPCGFRPVFWFQIPCFFDFNDYWKCDEARDCGRTCRSFRKLMRSHIQSVWVEWNVLSLRAANKLMKSFIDRRAKKNQWKIQDGSPLNTCSVVFLISVRLLTSPACMNILFVYCVRIRIFIYLCALSKYLVFCVYFLYTMAETVVFAYETR